MLETMSISAEYLCTIRAEIEAPITVSRTGGMTRRMIPIRGGTVAGRISGVILPGGADWQYVYDSGLADLEAQYCLRLDDGAVVEVKSSGIRAGAPEVMEKVYGGADVAPDAYYFRTAIKFTTSADAHLWLTRMLCVGIAGRDRETVMIRLFEIR